MKPELINGNGTFLAEAVRPLSPMLILLVFPLRADALLEEMVIRLEGELRSGRNVVLRMTDWGQWWEHSEGL